MSYWMTQSLLSSWRHLIDAEDPQAEKAMQSFLADLHREKRSPTDAMKRGIQFEDAINRAVAGEAPELNDKSTVNAVKRLANICWGGQAQVPVSGRLSVGGLDLVLFGICDYVKAGIIYDIKRVIRYTYGKYQNSPQHPMYLHLIPQAARFDYLIFDGTFCYRETYCRGDFQPIENTIAQFIQFLREMNLLDDYKTHWSMNEEREDKIYGV